MGVRFSNPRTGLFTSADQLVTGGSNAYSYPSDPVNVHDLTGLYWVSGPWRPIIKSIAYSTWLKTFGNFLASTYGQSALVTKSRSRNLYWRTWDGHTSKALRVEVLGTQQAYYRQKIKHFGVTVLVTPWEKDGELHRIHFTYNLTR